MQVKLFNPTIHPDAIEAANHAMRSGWLGMGPKVAEFETNFAKYLNVPYALATNTCTSALHLALRVLNLKPGSQVITTPNTFVATNQILLWENLTPVFADIDPRTGNIDPASVQKRITEKTAAILAVHFGGYACDFDALAIHNLPIIEDCAHAAGASYKNQRIGSSGNLAAFSFGATKNLTTADGGMLILQNQSQLLAAQKLRYLGISKDTYQRVSDSKNIHAHWEYDVPAVGLRYHMNDVNAAMGAIQLQHLDQENTRRAAIATTYNSLLQNIPGITLPTYNPDRQSSHYLYWILADNRDQLAAALLSRNITVALHYKPSTHYPIFKQSAKQSELPNAENFYARELTLPMHPQLTDEEIHYVADTIRKGW